MKKLKLEIIEDLAKKMKLSLATIKKNVYLLQKKYPKSTKNALAQIYAAKNGETIYRKLDKEDKESLPSLEFIKRSPQIKVKYKSKEKRLVLQKVIDYETSDYFKKDHIEELNKAYSFGCYTSVFILARKIIENLIIDILKMKYPENVKENKELYFDINQKRFKDFGIILKNFKSKKSDFGSENKAVERLCDLAKVFKVKANDKTHSWYHLVKNKKEVNDLNLEMIIEIIKKLEREVGGE